MYGRGNYAPQYGKGSHMPPPPFQQRPMAPPFQHRPVTPPAGYSGPFQYQQLLPPPFELSPPIKVSTSPLPNAPHSYHQPLQPPQVHVGNAVQQSYPPAQQNNMWVRDTQRAPSPPLPSLALLPPGSNLPEMFRPLVPYRDFVYTPQPGSTRSTNQLPPPPPPPTSSFFTPASLFASGLTPLLPPSPQPPLPPSSPPPIPPSPPPTTSPSSGALTSTALGTTSELPQIPKSGSVSISVISETIGSDSADKVASTSENMDDVNTAVDNKHLTDRAGAEVGSSALKDLASGEYTDPDLPPPPPKPKDEIVVQKIEVMCHSIAKNGLGFECITRQKESANPEFGFLFGGEPGSEAMVAYEYFKWVKKKCLLQRKKSNSALKLPNMSTSTQINLMDADVSPSVSDMEMEDDFTQLDDVPCETAFTPEERDNREQVCAPKNDVDLSPPKYTVPTFSQLGEEEKGPTLSHPNDQHTHENAFLKPDNLNTSSDGAAKLMESSYAGGSSSSSLDDKNPIVKSAGELMKGPSPFLLLQDYASDDSSEHDDKPSLEDVLPVRVLPSKTESNAILHVDVQSNFQTGLGSTNLPSPQLPLDKSSKSIGVQSLPSSFPDDEEPLQKPQYTVEEANIASASKVKTVDFVERKNKDKESDEAVVYPEAFGGKDVLEDVQEAAPVKRKPQFPKDDVQHTSTRQKVDEFGRFLRDVASDSDSDDSHHTRKHGKRGRSRSPPHDRRRSRGSPLRRREKRSRSRSWSPQKRRSRSRSPSYRRRGESGAEIVKKEKCFDFSRGRCHRGASCRYMHHETDKSASGRYNRSLRTSDRHEETRKVPLRRSIPEHGLTGNSGIIVKNEPMDQKEILSPEQGLVRNTVFNHDDKSMVAHFCKSERSSETTALVLESTDMVEISESNIKFHDTVHEHCREEEETANLGIESQANTSVAVMTSATIEDQIEISEPDLNRNASTISSQGAHGELPAPPPSLSQSTSITPTQRPEERFQPASHYPYQAQSQMQPPHYPTPPNTWPLPPPPALPTPLQQQFTNNFSAPTAIQDVTPPFQQNQFPARNDYRMFQQHSYPAPSSQTEDLHSKPISLNSHSSGFSLLSLGHSATSRMQSYPGNSFPSNEFSAPSSQIRTYIQQQQRHYGLHQPSSDGLRFGAYGNINASFGGSKIAHHYNPYASTFDQPFDSKLSSNVLNQGKDLSNANPFDASDSLNHIPLGAQPVISPTKIAQTTVLPKSGSNQYDPLFDSIEPSSSSFKKIDQSQGLDMGLRLSSSRTLDVGETYKEVETAAVSTSTKSNGEFGETADAEVGEVESGRSSNPLDGGLTALGEVEIDQVKSPGKGKKSKDSRSMKLFKSSLAEYVKEVLKPHWRQGGMSKEAFKIIVKKTIDKVCGAIKSHRVPKSQAKINRYIDSSERKLNKLVMGYVDKYAKI